MTIARTWQLQITGTFLAVLFACCLPAGMARAQDAAVPATKTPTPPRQPLVIVNVASIERLLTDVDWTFAVAGRPELSDFVVSLLGNVNDLQGLDRNRPLGVMIYLQEGLPPSPLPVFYLPVEKLETLVQTLGLGPLKPKKVEGQEGRYELVGRRQTMHLVQQGTYAYLSSSETLLDAELPDPEPIVESMSIRYDVALAGRLQTVPQAIRDVFLAYLRSTAEGELQRRDDEALGAYEARRAAGISTLELSEQVLTQCEQITIGWDASQSKNMGVLEVLVDAAPGSELAKYCQDIAAKPTRFSALFREEQPLTFAASWSMDAREKKAAEGFVKSFGESMRAEFEIPEGEPFPAVDRMTESLNATFRAGHADFCAQFVVPEPGRFLFFGGFGLVGSENFALGLRELLQTLQTEDKLDTVELDVGAHQGVTFHRIVAKNVPEREERIYGGKPGLYLGAGARTLWFAVGNEGALEAVEGAMDRVAESQATPQKPTHIPFQAVFRVSPWLQLPTPEDSKGAKTRQEFAKEAFSQASDSLRLELRPIDNGLRFRMQLDDGFMRLLGLSLAKRIDEANGF